MRKRHEAFGSWLRQELIRRGYPLDRRNSGAQGQFARDAHVGEATISRILSGDSRPEVATLRKIGRVLEYPMDELLTLAGYVTVDERSPPPPTPPTSSERPAAPRPTVRDDADERLINALERLPQHKKAVILPLVEAMLDEDEGD